MEKIHNWGGAFLPLRKHRDYCGKMENHITLVRDPFIADEDDVNEDGYGEDELIVINEGEGSIAWHLEMDWVGHESDSKTYEYVMMADEKPTKEEAISRLAQYIEEENARRRREGQREITDGSDPFAD